MVVKLDHLGKHAENLYLQILCSVDCLEWGSSYREIMFIDVDKNVRKSKHGKSKKTEDKGRSETEV